MLRWLRCKITNKTWVCTTCVLCHLVWCVGSELLYHSLYQCETVRGQRSTFTTLLNVFPSMHCRHCIGQLWFERQTSLFSLYRGLLIIQATG
jgi:hypothetical protein